jgi:hypothetical protein
MCEWLKQAVLKTRLLTSCCAESITYDHLGSWYSGAFLQFGNRMCNRNATAAPQSLFEVHHVIEDPSSTSRHGTHRFVAQLDLSAGCAGHLP